jgi:septal ring factor EnvC (AmiA/AmiB activator)
MTWDYYDIEKDFEQKKTQESLQNEIRAFMVDLKEVERNAKNTQETLNEFMSAISDTLESENYKDYKKMLEEWKNLTTIFSALKRDVDKVS